MLLNKLSRGVILASNPELEEAFDAVESAAFSNELDEMVQFVAESAKKKAAQPKEDDEDDNIIYAKNRSQALAKVLNPVKLPDAVDQEYNNIFFPKVKSEILDPITYIGEVGIYLRTALHMLRYLMTVKSQLNSDYIPWEERITNLLGMYFNGQMAHFTAPASYDIKEIIKTFLSPERASSGNTHIIRPSSFFKEGFDFIVTGSSNIANHPVGVVSSTNPDYIVDRHYRTEQSAMEDDQYIREDLGERVQQVVKTYRAVIESLIGEDAKTAAFTGSITPIRLTFDIRNIHTIIERGLGVQIPKLAEKLPKPLAINDRMKYFHMAIVTQPQGKWLQQAPEGQDRMATMMAEMSSAYKTFAFGVGVCPVISVSRQIAEYISQVNPNEQVSYLSLNQWFSIWTRQLLVPKNSKSVVGGRIRDAAAIPRYVLPMSKAIEATKVRKQEGMYVEPGRTDEHGFFINRRGLPEYLPSTDERDGIIAAADYEKRSEEMLRQVFDLGLVSRSAGSKIQGTTMQLMRSRGKDIAQLDAFNESLDTFKKEFVGTTLYYDWDTNIHCTVNNDDPNATTMRNLAGSARPTKTVIADLLGYNFAKEGERPIRKLAMETLFMIHPLPTGNSGKRSPEEMVHPQFAFQRNNSGSPFVALFNTYAYLQAHGKAPDLQTLIKEAIDNLGVVWEKGQERNYQYEMFLPLIGLDKTPNVGGGSYGAMSTVDWLSELMRITWNEALASRGTITRQVLEQRAREEGIAFSQAVEDNEWSFNAMEEGLGEMRKTYKLIGGEIFRLVCNAIVKSDKKMLFGTNLGGVDKYNDKEPVRALPSRTVATFVMPHAILFGKFVADAEQIFAEAESTIEKTQPDDAITEDDIKVAGAVDGSMLFPHQVKCHKTLRRAPEFALLDVAPGGGKTSLGLTDIASMLKEIGDGHFRPMIICPDGLIPNWCNDMKLFTGNKWNMIPLNSEVFNRWGEEKLTEMIKKAPRNTILVCGVHFLSPKNKDRYFVGGGAVVVSPTLEFIKQFQPNYIGIDESHWFKNPNSARTALIRSITTASHVKYLRLFTGTFIANRVDDALGQVSLFNAAALRSEDIFGDENLRGGDTNPETIREGAQRARQKLSQHAAVIRATRKEWAFLLAQPIERFIAVKLAYDEEDVAAGTVDRAEMESSKLHDSLYAVVMERSIEEIQKLVDEAKKKKRGSGDDEEDDDDKDEESEGDSLGFDSDDELGQLTPEQLKPYLQRIERLITSPEKDPLFEEIFGAAGITKYVPRKVKEIYRLIDEHFNPPKWEKGGKYKELDLVSHAGKLYLSRKLDMSTPNRKMLSDATIGVSPDQLTDVWREEPEGKLIIFTRYIDTVDSIYENMPDNFKSIAVPFHGQLRNAKGNLHLFKNDPKIKILVANEQSIKEGHNMQMASRIIRVEWPWTPGDLEQSKSRILRPDVKANKAMIKDGKAGELFREAIFLDWVVADNTMEVNKHARLIWKTVEKAYFDEDNPENLKELDNYELSPVRLGMEMLRDRNGVEAFSDYYEAYNTVNGINRREFHEMRIKEKPSMRMLPHDEPETQMPKDSAKIEVPFVNGMDIVDEKGYGLINGADFIRMEGNEEYLKDPQNLLGKPVLTDRGPGIIVNVRTKWMGNDGQAGADGKKSKARMRDAEGNKVVDALDPVSSIAVQFAGSDETQRVKLGLVFIATEVDQKTQRAVFEKGRTPKIVKEEDEPQISAKELKAQKERALREQQDRVRAAIEKDNRQQGEKRRENIKSGKPINAGVVSVVKKVDKLTPEDRSAKRLLANQPDKHITLHPAAYHGYLVLEMETDDPDSIDVKKHGFKDSGQYAYITVDRYNRFEKLLDYVEENFNLSGQTIDRLEHVQDAFEEGPKGIYRSELAPHSTLPYFFNVRKRIVTDKKEIRPYPIIMPEHLLIAVDVATSPAIRKHIGKSVPGTGGKWALSDGNTMYFANNKADLQAKVKELQKAGYTIDNLKQLEKEIANLKFRAPRSKK